MFAPDVHAQMLVAQDRVDSLAAAASRDGVTDPINRVEAQTPASRRRRTEPAARTLPGAVHPPHIGSATPAGLDLSHGTNLRRRPDAPCYTRTARRRSSAG